MKTGLRFVQNHHRRRTRREQGGDPKDIAQGAVREYGRAERSQQPFLCKLDGKAAVRWILQFFGNIKCILESLGQRLNCRILKVIDANHNSPLVTDINDLIRLVLIIHCLSRCRQNIGTGNC